ncbi:MAG TPA: STAS domain-containing protein [Burkholderiales bacterium]|nr:STAS domain-containing protein [Burkholderiales bacterium]
MIRREGRRITLSGPVTLANATRLLDEGRKHLAEGARTVDLGEVTELDSALLAVILAWLRDSRAAKRELAFANVPQPLQTLARLYGVEELLPVAR